MATTPEGRFYLAECLWPDVTREQVDDAARRARAAAEQLSPEAAGTRYVGSVLVPRDEVVFFQFEAPSALDVESVCRAAEIPFERVVESEHVPAP